MIVNTRKVLENLEKGLTDHEDGRDHAAADFCISKPSRSSPEIGQVVIRDGRGSRYYKGNTEGQNCEQKFGHKLYKLEELDFAISNP